MGRGLDVRIRVVFDHRSTVHGPRIAPIHDGRRVAGAFPYGDGRDISLGDEPDVRELSPQPLPRYEVSHLERLRLGMLYSRQVDHLDALLGRSSLHHLQARVLVDYAGFGRPVFDMFAGRRLLCLAQGVVTTGGREVPGNRAGWSVPKGELVSKLRALLHSGDLRIAASLPDAAVLMRELQDFRVRFTESGNATFNTREGAHDDLVLALALAVFGQSRPETVREVDVRWPT